VRCRTSPECIGSGAPGPNSFWFGSGRISASHVVHLELKQGSARLGTVGTVVEAGLRGGGAPASSGPGAVGGGLRVTTPSAKGSGE
jgi:hypothetical protein